MEIKSIIAPLSDIPMFYISILTMYKVHMHVGAIILYVCAYLLEIIHSLKLVDYLSVHTHKPYNCLHLYHNSSSVTIPSDVVQRDMRY